jgi:hypothetical protein
MLHGFFHGLNYNILNRTQIHTEIASDLIGREGTRIRWQHGRGWERKGGSWPHEHRRSRNIRGGIIEG